jgi:hypothetical protein
MDTFYMSNKNRTSTFRVKFYDASEHSPKGASVGGSDYYAVEDIEIPIESRDCYSFLSEKEAMDWILIKFNKEKS